MAFIREADYEEYEERKRREGRQRAAGAKPAPPIDYWRAGQGSSSVRQAPAVPPVDLGAMNETARQNVPGYAGLGDALGKVGEGLEWTGERWREMPYLAGDLLPTSPRFGARLQTFNPLATPEEAGRYWPRMREAAKTEGITGLIPEGPLRAAAGQIGQGLQYMNPLNAVTNPEAAGYVDLAPGDKPSREQMNRMYGLPTAEQQQTWATEKTNPLVEETFAALNPAYTVGPVEAARAGKEIAGLGRAAAQSPAVRSAAGKVGEFAGRLAREEGGYLRLPGGAPEEGAGKLYDAAGNLIGKPSKVEQALEMPGALPAEPRTILGPRGEALSLVGPEGAAIGRTAQAARYVDPAKLPQEVRTRLPNIAKIKDMPDVVQTLVASAQDPAVGAQIDRFRRGVITHRELIEDLAPRLGMTADYFLRRGPGRAFNETELLTLRAAVVSKTGELADLASSVAARGGIGALSDTEKVGAMRQLVEAARLQAVARGAASTAGRTLNQQKITIDRAMAEALTGSNERLAAQRAAKAAEEKLAAAKARADLRAQREAEAELAAAQRRQTRADALAQRASERQSEQARRILDALGGREASEDVLRNWLAVQQSGDPLAVAKFVRGLQRPSLWDRLSIVRYGSMLSATSTHLTNSLSNVGQLALDVGLKPLAVAIDIPRATITGTPRTRYMAEVGPQLRGTLEGFVAGAKEAGTVLRTGIDPGDVGKLEHIRPGFQSGSAVGDFAIEWPLRALVAADKLLRGAAFGGNARALAIRQAIGEGYKGPARARRAEEVMQNLSEFPELIAQADRQAARVVLQESRAETAWLAQGRHVPGFGKVYELAVPFVKTPWNIAAQGAGLTPAGFLAAVRAGRAGQTGEAVDRTARALFGTAVMGVGTTLAAGGLLTAGYPDDATERSTLPPGWQPWSVRIPGAGGEPARYVGFQNLGPIGIPLAISALYGDSLRRGQPITDLNTHAKVAIGVGRYGIDQTFARGIFDLLRAMEEPERYAENLVENIATQFLPYASLQRQITRSLDMGARDPHGAIEALLAINPLTAGQVGERLTPLGDVARQEPTGAAAFVSPLRVTTERDEPVLQAMREAGVGIPRPPRSTQGVALEDPESKEVQRVAGGYLREWTAGLVADPAFRELPTEARAKVLENLRDSARKVAAAEILSRLSAEELTRRDMLSRR